MDDSAGGVEKENDYRDDTQKKGSAQQSYLIPLKLHQLLSLSALPTFSQNLNHCYNEWNSKRPQPQNFALKTKILTFHFIPGVVNMSEVHK